MCASEVSDIEDTLWQEYQDQGLVVWAIAPDDPVDFLVEFSDDMGLSFPILHDDGGTTHDDYNPVEGVTNSIYPQDWVIGVDGTVLYMSRAYEPDEMIAIVEQELAKMD